MCRPPWWGLGMRCCFPSLMQVRGLVFSKPLSSKYIRSAPSGPTVSSSSQSACLYRTYSGCLGGGEWRAAYVPAVLFWASVPAVRWLTLTPRSVANRLANCRSLRHEASPWPPQVCTLCYWGRRPPRTVLVNPGSPLRRYSAPVLPSGSVCSCWCRYSNLGNCPTV